MIERLYANTSSEDERRASQAFQAGLCPPRNGNERADTDLDREICGASRKETEEIKSAESGTGTGGNLHRFLTLLWR